MSNLKIELESILKIGKVTSVKGRYVEILVDKSKNTSHLLYNGEIIKNVSVGSYVKITKGFEELVGKIDGEFVVEDKLVEGKKYLHEKERIKRILNISLLGYFEKKKFKQGIKELPLIENECYLLTQTEFDRVHNFIKEINGVEDIPIKIGNLSSEKGKSIKVGINSLFASHIGIFGNTGSGKSYTLASLYYSLFNKFQEKEGFRKNANFIFFDFNGEYSSGNCLSTKKVVFNLSTRKKLDKIKKKNKLPINENSLLDVDLLSILASATEKTQKPYLVRTIRFYKRIQASDEPLEFFKNTIKKKIRQVLKMANKDKAHALIDYLISILGGDETHKSLFEKIEWNNTNHHFMPKGGQSRQLTANEIQETSIYEASDTYEFPSNVLNKIVDFLYLQLIFDVYNDKVIYEHIGPAIHKLQSKTQDLEKVIDFTSEHSNIFKDGNIVLINLNDSNIDIKKIIPLVLTKNIYEKQKKKYKKDNTRFLNIVIDEAHNILSYTSERESQTWKDYRLETFEEIIKEGRKFGVFLTVASQRPSDISSTIISQLHNYFLHRLINNKDIEAVERTISYLDKVSFDALPILPTGSCILAGLSAQVPVIIEIDKIDDEFEPYNKTIKPTDFWE